MIYTVSNMWPTSNKPSFGVFVARIHDSIDCDKNTIILRQPKTNSYKFLFYFLFYIQQFIQYYRSKPSDVFVVHYVSLSGVGVVLARYIFGKRGKLVGFCHGSDLKFNKNGVKEHLLSRLTKFFLRASDACICPSEYLRTELIEVYRYEKHILVSPSGGVPKYMFSENSIFGRKYLFGYIGRISKDKGSFDFLEAMTVIKSDLPEASILLLGTVENTRELEIYKNKLGSKIKIVPALPHAELRDYFREITFFIYGTHYDSLGLVGLEAMANGCVVITNCAVGPGSYVIDGVDGICTLGIGADAIGEKLDYCSRLPKNALQQLSRRAYRKAFEYSEEAVRERLNNFLNEKV